MFVTFFEPSFCDSLIISDSLKNVSKSVLIYDTIIVPYEITKKALGHSSVKTTIDVYSHVDNKNSKRMREDIGNVIKIF